MYRAEQPLVGFRAFRSAGPRLVSPLIHHARRWERTMHAECTPYYTPREGLIGRLSKLILGPPLHEAPVAECSCGLYAHYELATVEHYWPIYGAVVAWGRVMAHRTGFRAEHMRVLALALNPAAVTGDPVEITRVADALGVPCLQEGQLEPFASEFGMVLDPGMRGEQ